MDLSFVELITRERMAEVDRWAARRAALRALPRRPRSAPRAGLRARLGAALIALGRRLAEPECQARTATCR
jgi:hypothetical protein